MNVRKKLQIPAIVSRMILNQFNAILLLMQGTRPASKKTQRAY